ncbi:hypothetical protein DFQ30_007952, partial [Apophysomyces sp. BC1015]
MGKCSKLHSKKLQEQYQEDVRHDPRKSMDSEHLRSLERFVGERNRDVARAKEKLETIRIFEDGSTRKM